MKIKENQITVYWSGEFMGSINKQEGTLIQHGTRKYAQYNNAPFVEMVPAGKRKGIRISREYNPFILILEGTGHPDPQSMWGEITSSSPGITVRQAKYSSFDDRWETDFDQMIDGYVAQNNVKVIADYRHTKGFSSYDRFQSKVA